MDSVWLTAQMITMKMVIPKNARNVLITVPLVPIIQYVRCATMIIFWIQTNFVRQLALSHIIKIFLIKLAILVPLIAMYVPIIKPVLLVKKGFSIILILYVILNAQILFLETKVIGYVKSALMTVKNVKMEIYAIYVILDLIYS
jgi:hypothetical protein